jgi:hypothetical protein
LENERVRRPETPDFFIRRDDFTNDECDLENERVRRPETPDSFIRRDDFTDDEPPLVIDESKCIKSPDPASSESETVMISGAMAMDCRG